ncbi:MAG: Na+/H+ antiporter NhaC family protein [Bacteroidota bacterium]
MQQRTLLVLFLGLAGLTALGAQVEPQSVPPAAPPDAPVLLEAPPAEEPAEPVPTWLSIVPALVAIAAALAFRQVVAALFAGIWIGAWLVRGGIDGLWLGLLDTVQVYVLQALADADHAAIIIFTLMIGGVVGVIQKNGGTKGIVSAVVAWASSARRGQLATSFLGLAIFFDDYANTLIVGGTMRPITDRLRISREKLAYIVDSTAAPIASLALVTTWIGYEVGLIGEAVARIDGYDEAAYSVFLNSLAYSFYPVLAILFVLAVAAWQRDFGPMLAAERRARQTGQLFRPGSDIEQAEAESSVLVPDESTPARALNAVVPILVLIVGVVGGLFATGEGDSVREIISSADSYRAMLWASLLAVVVAVALSVGQRILTLTEALDAWYAGMKAMLLAIIILILAWALSGVNDALGTADWLVLRLSGSLAVGLVPALVFLLAAATAFSTGSSWGTMGILMPLVVPLAWGVLSAEGMAEPEHYHILYSSVSAVLAGAVWGDHCSPISDTTILSSLASGCDHIDHVRTQLPYALLVGTGAILLGTLPAGFGVPWWLCLPVAAVVLLAGLRFFGEPVEATETVRG